MKSEQERPTGKICYEKPTAVDLGPAAPIVGASCAPGGVLEQTGYCKDQGNDAIMDCNTGTGAVGTCIVPGNIPGLD